MYNYRCDSCGAYLDPGERCTCSGTHEKNLRMVEELLSEEQDGQIVLKEARENGTNTRLRRMEDYPSG